MKLTLVNDSGAAGSAMDVSEAVFGAAFNQPLVHQVVVAYQANGRQATRKQKTRAEVRGGGRKPWKQKGSGRARAGTIRSPLWRGGGKVFPSTMDENFEQKVNRKMYRGAMRAILSELARQERLFVVADFSVAEPKTSSLASKLQAMGAPDALIVAESIDRNLELAARNLPHVDVCAVAAADPVSLIGFEKVIMTQGAIKKFEEMLG